MKFYAGLDVSLSETSICIVDEKRKVVNEGRVGSEPETIAAWLARTGYSFERLAWKRDRWRLLCTMGWRLPGCQ